MTDKTTVSNVSIRQDILNMNSEYTIYSLALERFVSSSILLLHIPAVAQNNLVMRMLILPVNS